MKNNQIYRKELFTHLDGIVLFPTLNGLIETKILDEMINLKSFTINDISKKIVLNKGYLNVALRLLHSTNFIDCDQGETDETSTYKIKNDLFSLLESKAGELNVNYSISELENISFQTSQLKLFDYSDQVIDDISKLDISSMTPLEAISKLYEIQHLIEKNKFELT